MASIFRKACINTTGKKGLPENVELINSKASEIELEGLDTVFSILSLHEIDLEKTLEKLSDALKEDGKVFIVDWSKNAETENMPPREKLYTARKASEKVSKHFKVKNQWKDSIPSS